MKQQSRHEQSMQMNTEYVYTNAHELRLLY